MKTSSIGNLSVTPGTLVIYEQATTAANSMGFVLQPAVLAREAVSIQVDSDLPEADQITDRLQKFMDASQAYLDAFDDERLTEGVLYSCMWAAKDARNYVMDIIDKNMAAGDPDDKVSKLQDIVDTLSSYVQDHLKMEMDEEEAQKTAYATYADLGYAESDDKGELVEVQFLEAMLNTAARRKHATVVRTKSDGSKEYKFPIPDKAHARAALARLEQSDLTPAEKAKVKKRAYRVLGQTPSKKSSKESHQMDVDDTFVALGEAEDATIGGSMDDLQLVTIGEATKFDLAKGELEITFIQPGLNTSGKRYYPKETIAEGIELFKGKKMFLNHASLQELTQRPERSLTEWVSTIKETWVDPTTGAGKATVKVVQTWFKNFLKDLQEAGALPDIGVSIFASGKTKPGTIGGKATNIVEKFVTAMSVDWVTEPGAGGRVDAIWESHRPLMIKEQELNVLESLKSAEALAQIKESRPDIYEAVRAEFASTAQTEAEKAAAEADKKAQDDRIAALETQLKEAGDATVAEKAARVKAQHERIVTEALAESKLPDLAKARIRANVAEPVLLESGEIDETKVKETIAAAVKAEEDYIGEMLKASGKGGGIQGLGESGKPAAGEGGQTIQEAAEQRVQTDLDKRFGFAPEKTETAAKA